jgi:multiple sugar transport system permease protein
MTSSTNPKQAKKRNGWGFTLLAWGIAVVFLFPVLWMAIMMFKPEKVMFEVPTAWLFSPTLDHFKYIFELKLLKNIGISLVLSIGSTLLVVLIGTPAAYAFSRFAIWHRDDLFLFILATRMAPPVAVVIPFYLIYTKLGLLDTYTGLIVLYCTFNLSFYVWVLGSFCRDIPVELEEAAMADGYPRWQILVKIVMPLLRPGIIATSVLCFIFAWNEFLFAFMIGGKTIRTLPTVFPSLISAKWGPLSIMGIVALLPVLVVVFFVQRHIVRGLTMGAVKG